MINTSIIGTPSNKRGEIVFVMVLIVEEFKFQGSMQSARVKGVLFKVKQ